MDSVAKDAHSAVELLWNTPSVMARFEASAWCRWTCASNSGWWAWRPGRAARPATSAAISPMASIASRTFPSRPGTPATFSPGRTCAGWKCSDRWRSSANNSSVAGGPRSSSRPGPLAADHVAVTLIEGWRGEICHVAMTGDDGRFAAYKVVDPSFHNWFGLAMACETSRFPISLVQQELQSVLLRSRSLTARRSMFDVLLARWKQGHRTMRYPAGPPPELPERFAGRPALDAAKCADASDAGICVSGTLPHAAPSAVEHQDGHSITTTRHGPVPVLPRVRNRVWQPARSRFSRDYRLAASQREDLVVRDATAQAAVDTGRGVAAAVRPLAQAAPGQRRRLQRLRSRHQRVGNRGWDLGRFGIQFVASPRHADGLLITGPVPENMRLALRKDL